MKPEEINRKIAELLENTQCEEQFADAIIEDCKKTIIDIAKSIVRSADMEEWMEVNKGIRALIMHNNRAIDRELEIKREKMSK